MTGSVIGFILGLGTVVVFMLVASQGYIFQFIDIPSTLIVFMAGIFLSLATYRPGKLWQAVKDLWTFEGEEISKEERERLIEGARIFERIETIFVSLGFAGMLIGTINLLAHPEDPSTIGPSMAVALISALYSVILAKLICQPARLKLLHRANSLKEAYKFRALVDWRLLLFIALALLLFVPLPY